MPYYINLNPASAENKLDNRLFKWFVGYGKYYLLFFNIVLFTLYLTRMYLTGINFLKRKELEDKLTKVEQLAPLARKYDSFQQLASTVSKIKEKNFEINTTLKSFQQNTPEGIYIERLSVSEDKILLTAVSRNSADFFIFLNFLVKEKSFDRVLLESSEYANDLKSYRNSFEITKAHNGTN